MSDTSESTTRRALIAKLLLLVTGGAMTKALAPTDARAKDTDIDGGKP